jgi:hypothetical protein
VNRPQVEFQGNCPRCLQSAVCVSAGPDGLSHWGTCPTCHVRWPIGHNLFSLDRSIPEWQDPRRNGENHDLLAGYERVECANVLEDEGAA